MRGLCLVKQRDAGAILGHEGCWGPINDRDEGSGGDVWKRSEILVAGLVQRQNVMHMIKLKMLTPCARLG